MAQPKVVFVEPKDLKKDDLILDIRPNIKHARLALDRPHWHRDARLIDPKKFIRAYHLDGKKRLNIICTSGYKAELLAKKFIKAGYPNVAAVRGGIEYADAQGIAMVRLSMPDLAAQVHLTAGILVLVGLVLGFFASAWFYLIALLTALGLIVSGVTGNCTLSRILEKMPWNVMSDLK